MREALTSLLDALAILLVAAGLGCQTAGWITLAVRGSYGFSLAMIGVALTVAGLVVAAGSAYASRPAQPNEEARP